MRLSPGSQSFQLPISFLTHGKVIAVEIINHDPRQPMPRKKLLQGVKRMRQKKEKPRTMSSVEARRGRDEPEDKPSGGLENVPEYPPDRYKKVKSAESFAKNVLQITEVNYNKDVRIGNTVNRAILSLAKRNVPVPHGVFVDPEQFQGEAENWLAFYELLLANEDEPGRIYINPNPTEWASDQAMKERRGQFSTGSRYHAIVHELAELAYHQTIGTERFRKGSRENRFDEHLFQQRIKKKPAEIREAVSEYALKNHTEFVCEVFTALMLGRDELLDNKRVMEIYHELEGPRQFEE
jgi:hypothetical protein